MESLDIAMASKIRYWKCADCASMINDESMQLMEEWPNCLSSTKYVEFCYGCMSYNPEVVIAYA